MIVYRVHKHCVENNSEGFSWHRTVTSAKNALREYVSRGGTIDDVATIERIEIEITAPGIMRALRMFASHPDNG